MRLITLLTASPERTTEVLSRLKTLSPPPGLKVEAVLSVFGRYDGCVIIEASDEKAAMEFIVGQIRAIPGVTSTETLLAREV